MSDGPSPYVIACGRAQSLQQEIADFIPSLAAEREERKSKYTSPNSSTHPNPTTAEWMKQNVVDTSGGGSGSKKRVVNKLRFPHIKDPGQMKNPVHTLNRRMAKYIDKDVNWNGTKCTVKQILTLDEERTLCRAIQIMDNTLHGGCTRDQFSTMVIATVKARQELLHKGLPNIEPLSHAALVCLERPKQIDEGEGNGGRAVGRAFFQRFVGLWSRRSVAAQFRISLKAGSKRPLHKIRACTRSKAQQHRGRGGGA